MSFRPSLRSLALIVFWAATVAYVAFGTVGVVFGPFELAPFVSHDATAFGQIRFLKACELAVGAAFWMLRQRIHHDPFAQRFVAFVLVVTPLARIVAMASDGWPIPLFQAIAAMEVLGGLVFSAWVFGTRRAVAAS